MTLFPLKGELGLFIESFNDTLKLQPESDSVFFDSDDGTRFYFKFDNDVVTAFDVERFKAIRISDN